MSVSSESTVSDMDKLTADIADLLQNVAPDSCFVQLFTSKSFSQPAPVCLPEKVTDVFARLPHASLHDKLAALTATEEAVLHCLLQRFVSEILNCGMNTALDV